MVKPQVNPFMKYLRPRFKPGLQEKYMRDIECGAFSPPRSFDILKRYQTEELKLRHGRPPHLHFKENWLMKGFADKHPQVQLEPVTLNSFQPPLIKQLALRQMQLRLENHGHKTAAEQAEQEYRSQLNSLSSGDLATTSVLDLVQQEEAEALDSALQAVAAGEAVPDTAARR